MQSQSMLVRFQLANKEENRSCPTLESLWAEAHNLDFSPMVIMTYSQRCAMSKLKRYVMSFK